MSCDDDDDSGLDRDCIFFLLCFLGWEVFTDEGKTGSDGQKARDPTRWR